MLEEAPLNTPEVIEPATPAVRLWLTMCALCLAFFAASVDMRWSEGDPSDEDLYTSDERAELISDGSTVRKAAFLSLGVLGAYFCLQRGRRSLAWHDALTLASVGLCVWCAASILWSADPALSLRRVVSLLCVGLAGFGLARQITPREFVRLVFALTLIWFSLGLFLEIGTGRLRPWIADYRFSGWVHPNNQGVFCGLLCLASLAMIRQGANGLWLRVVPVAAVVGLLLTRSRTSAAALVAGLFVVWLVTPGGRKLPWLFVPVWAACLVMLGLGLAGTDFDGLYQDTVLMGRAEYTESLTGRLPLWTEVVEFIGEHPVLGFGYGAFWDAQHTDDISTTLKWAVPDSHSSFIDAVLNLGLVGGIALVAVLALAISYAARAYKQSLNPSIGFLLAMVVFASVDAFAESDLIQPSVLFFLTVSAISLLALHAHTAPEVGVHQVVGRGASVGLWGGSHYHGTAT